LGTRIDRSNADKSGAAKTAGTPIKNGDNIMLIHDKSFFLSVNDTNDGMVLRETKFKHTSHVILEERAGQFEVCCCSMPYEKKATEATKISVGHNDFIAFKARQHLSLAKRKAETKREAMKQLVDEQSQFTLAKNAFATSTGCKKWTDLESKARDILKNR
jgi:hypothetical protein